LPFSLYPNLGMTKPLSPFENRGFVDSLKSPEIPGICFLHLLDDHPSAGFALHQGSAFDPGKNGGGKGGVAAGTLTVG